MSKLLPGTVESHRIARSPADLAELVLKSDRQAFEQMALKLWADHVKRVCLEAQRAWLDLEES